MSNHSHSHSHSHDPGISGARGSAFRWSVLLNSVLSGLQIVIGVGFGSLALISDAIHNLGDVAGLLLAWGAEHLSDRPASGRFTYGFGRSTQLAALVNATLILMAAAVVIVEGLQRLRDPQPISSTPVIWAATAGILVNLFSARLFGHDHGRNLNRKAAVVHLLTDAAVSAAVLVSAVLVSCTGWDWIDPLTAVGVGLAVAWSGWGLMREAVLVNLDGVPRPIELDLVRQTLQQLPGVEKAHHVHIWAMSTSRTALTAHLRCRNNGVSDTALLAQARERLAELGIDHSTLELEWVKPGETPA
ncbi:cation diffusion facilitator family transporter [Synechococcus sp. CCY9201]|uniref:cation diffusion facilitator family transporter n=1 Tax=Synechococcus sp. CCY9201 TaxID=174697 RepID=UPI002B215F5D|nr:cation diffusion facilitator family transporter [Synechococcus sp. CCY9201]MEA5475910.1 cation diffusion facilitator family transporter [Synechococcus sp. CCY9201]